MRRALALWIAVGLTACVDRDPAIARDLVAEDRWIALETQVDRRHAIASKLVAAARVAGRGDDRALLEATEARSRANLHMSAEDLRDPLKIAAFVRAEERLRRALPPIATPEDRAELSVIDAEVARAMVAYDEAAREYDEVIANLPKRAVNRLTGRRFTPRARWAAQ